MGNKAKHNYVVSFLHNIIIVWDCEYGVWLRVYIWMGKNEIDKKDRNITSEFDQAQRMNISEWVEGIENTEHTLHVLSSAAVLGVAFANFLSAQMSTRELLPHIIHI